MRRGIVALVATPEDNLGIEVIVQAAAVIWRASSRRAK